MLLYLSKYSVKILLNKTTLMTISQSNTMKHTPGMIEICTMGKYQWHMQTIYISNT